MYEEAKRGRLYVTHPIKRGSRPAPVPAVVSAADSQTGEVTGKDWNEMPGAAVVRVTGAVSCW